MIAKRIGIIWQFSASKVDRAALEDVIINAGNCYYKKFGSLPGLAILNVKHIEQALDQQIGTVKIDYKTHVAINCVHVYGAGE